MSNGESTISKGLEGVVIDESRICLVDGAEGDIWYSGYHIDELATKSSFTEVLSLLWSHELPTGQELEEMESSLQSQRTLAPHLTRLIDDAAEEAAPMDLLRTAVSLRAASDPDPHDLDAIQDKLLRVVAGMPGIIARSHRSSTGKEPIEPTETGSYAESFLQQFRDESPADDHVAALETALILYAEHGMNASTFSARVTASTLANPYAAITSAIGTLEGPLHGGATEDVIDVLEAIGGPDEVESWVDDRLEAGETVPGFGHRVYRVPDPRCAHFQREIDALTLDAETERLYETAEALRDIMEDRLGEKGIYPNTDLYSGIFFQALDIPPALFTAVFAMGRVAGWSAHVIEQVADNRLIRPRVKYVGDVGNEYVPLEGRD